MPDPLSPIHVVAGIISDPRGHYLLSRRQASSDLSGLWEFPGGKREQGESAQAALRRELQEELGITADIGDQLIVVPQIYPHKYIRLEVRHVVAWEGHLHGREGQALMWVDPQKLSRYSMPTADLPAIAALLDPHQLWWAVFCPQSPQRWVEQFDEIFDHCSSRIVLHPSPQVSLQDWQQSLQQSYRSRRRSRSKAHYLVADQIDLANALGLGVHLSEDRLMACLKRPISHHQLLGASCHSTEAVCHAQSIGCDYAVLAVSHSSPVPARGRDWQFFEQLRARVSLPLYVSEVEGKTDLCHVRQYGAQGIVQPYAFAVTHSAFP